MNRIVLINLTLPAALFAAPSIRSGENTRKRCSRNLQKLETYNAAAHIFQHESTRSRSSGRKLSFELSGFRSGNVAEILNKPYADLVTLPTGDSYL